jgi:ATP-dependent DNA helicase DinG
MSSGFEREVKEFLGPDGPLARLLPRYEERPEQSAMAGAALKAQERDSILIVEAGTGTGKTLAYLVPAIYSARRVLISTGTKALQEQLMNKDLPVLAREFEVRAALMKGRNNYLCWKRYHEFGQAPTFSFREDIPVYDRIRKWANKTRTGDRAEIRGLPDDYSSWRELSASSEQCIGQKCEYFKECFVIKMRAEAQGADIIVVNHHLFFADLAIRADAPSAIIPEYQTVIFDEAHSLPEIATEYFGVQVSTWRMNDLAQDIRRIQRLGRFAVDDLRAALKALDLAETSFAAVLHMVASHSRGGQANGEGSRFSLAPLREDPGIIEECERAGAELRQLSHNLGQLGGEDESMGGLADRANTMASELGFILSQDDPDHVYWAETRGRGVILRASPAELGPILADTLFAPEIPLVFTSATLAVQSQGKWSFSHFKRELGLEEPPRKLDEVWLPSSYNWKENAVLYVPDNLPDPNRPEFINKAAKVMEKIVKISRGRAFILFTSYRNLEAAHEMLAHRLPCIVLKQGDAPKSEILDAFREDESSVLFATQSFWAGVDVSGQALSCVIIDKLPFASPGDPLMSARIDRIKRAGGNAFMDYQLPAAVLSLKQGLGRLIRTSEDYGILAVLDSRIHKKRYGRTFIQSLPPAPLTTEIDDLESFIKKHEGG